MICLVKSGLWTVNYLIIWYLREFYSNNIRTSLKVRIFEYSIIHTHLYSGSEPMQRRRYTFSKCKHSLGTEHVVSQYRPSWHSPLAAQATPRDLGTIQTESKHLSPVAHSSRPPQATPATTKRRRNLWEVAGENEVWRSCLTDLSALVPCLSVTHGPAPARLAVAAVGLN